MRNYLLTIILLSLTLIAKAHNISNYSISALSEQLKSNADAVTRLEKQEFIVKSVDEATLKVHRVVTILTPQGDSFAPLYISYDPQRKVKNISCYIYDAQGKEIKKVKKSEMEDFSANASYSLFEDNRMIYYMYNSHQYPFTVEYSYEIDFEGVLYYPDWDPVGSDKHAVVNSSFSISLPEGMEYRHKNINYQQSPQISSNNGMTTSTWQLSNFNAVKKEPLSPDFSSLLPAVYFAPTEFEFEGYKGNMKSWKEFGLWFKNLNEGRDILSPQTQSDVLKLVENVADKREKVKLIYEYMQSKTRYVSIQLGIGGFQPFEASTVEKVGYGDCKALTNYTKALLEIAGIPSIYTLIRAGADASPILKDFPSTQFNHAILCVPMAQDTIWLECTDQNNPFDYLGYFTCDRDVLLITEEGGKIAHTKAYSREENLQIRKAQVTLDESGQGDANILTTFQGLQYDHISPLLEMTANEQNMVIYQKTAVPNFTLTGYQYQKLDKEEAVIEEELQLKLENYAQISSSRLFFVPNLMNQMDATPPAIENRKNEVVVTKSFVDIDTIVFNIPENLHPEFIPEASTIDSEFGEYSISFLQEQGKITYIRSLKTNKGTFEADQYEQLIRFYEKIAQKDAQKIVLKKST